MEKKKIFDIIPPKEIEPSPVTQREKEKPTFFVEKLEPPAKKPISQKPPSRFKRGPILVSIALILIGTFGFVFIKPAAVVEIWPVGEPVDFKTQLTVDSSIEKVDPALWQIEGGGLIPGEVLLVEKTVSDEFSSTGTKIKETRAQGTIRVYNDYSTDSQILVATTRFVSDDGKLFRTPNRVVIPGGHYEEGKLVPGSIDITVVADQPGGEYNIGPSTFSIPGFAGTAKYTGFYAKSFEPMTGGEKTKVSQITQGDLDGAKEILIERALKESRIALANSISSGEYVLVEGATESEITETTPLAEKGQETEHFLFQVKAEAEALVFKKSDLENFAITYIRSQIPQQKELQKNSLSIKYSPQTIDLKKGKIILSLEMSAKIYSVIDEDALKEIIKSKRPDEIKELFKNFPGINRTQVRLSPFWVTKAPKDMERIKINLNLD